MGVGGWGAGSSKIKANIAKLELELGLSFATLFLSLGSEFYYRVAQHF
jgi:hypothetical protein